MWEATRSDPCSSGAAEMQTGAGMKVLTGDQRKDCRGTASHSGSGNNRHNDLDIRQNDSPKFKGIVTSDKVSENIGILTQLRRDSNNGAGLAENAFSSVVSSPVAPRATDFQFDVRSEDGIQLCVDLNSTPSDWIESLKSGVHICQCHGVPGGRSLGLQDLDGKIKSYSHVDSDKEMNNGNFEDGSSPNTVATGVQTQAGEPDVGEGLLPYCGPKSCSYTIRSQENTGDKHAESSGTESDREKEASGAKFCERNDNTVPADSPVDVVTQIRTCNSSGKSCDPKHAVMLQNQLLKVGSDVYENFSVQRINGLPNPAPKYMVSPASTSKEIQRSPFTPLGQDVAPSSSRAGMPMDVAAQLRFSEREHCGSPQSAWYPGNMHKLQSFQTADAIRHVNCSSMSGGMEDKHCRAAFSNKPSSRVAEELTHLATCRKESASLSPCERYGSLGIVHLTNKIGTENGGFLPPGEPGQHSSVIGVNGGNESLSHRSNGVALDLLVAQQNEVGDCILTCSNKLDLEHHKSQLATDAANVGTSNVGDRKERSQCLDRGFMERMFMTPANSESNGELKRKRQFNGIEDQIICFNSDSRISRTSNQSSGDVHESRRRSSRFTK